jgi:SPP1 family predicted phage head-tail adaptor
MVDSGDLDQRVTFQTKVNTSDGAGGSTTTWADVADTPTVWAQALPLMGREITQESGDAATAEYKFTVRYRTDISEVERIVWNGSNHNIRRVERTSGRELFLVIIAERGVSN